MLPVLSHASNRSRFGLAAIAGVSVLLIGSSAGAQQYPTRPITAIVPHAPGGGTDITARIVTDKMKEILGQPMVVENIAAAAGTVGVARLASAPADGYTIGIGDQTSFVISGLAYKPSYDVLSDFQPISLLSTSAAVLLARKSLPPATAKELIDWVKANPGGATVATFGRGSGPFITAIALQNMTGIRLRAVTYQGVAAGMQDLIAGSVDLSIAETGAALPHVRSGAIKFYGVLSNSRAIAAPDLPTIEESGGPPLYSVTWRGLWGPKGMSKDVIERLNQSIVTALNDPGVQKRIAEAAQQIAPLAMQSPQGLAAYHKASLETLAPLVKAAAAAEQ